MSLQIDVAVRSALLAASMRQVPFSVGGQVVATLALVLVLRGGVPDDRLGLWLCGWAVSLIASVWLPLAYRRIGAAAAVAPWERRFFWVTQTRALAWLAAVVWLFPEDILRQLYFVCIVFGLVSAAPASLAGQRRALMVYLILILAPFALRFYVVGEVTASRAVLGAAVAFLLLLFMGIGRRMNDSMAEALRLRFENQALAENLARQQAATEAARERADEASAQKTRFLAAASHDLRQPVHAIGLMVAALREEPLTERAAGMLARLSDSVRGLDGLFGSLLDISRLDAGGVRPAPRPVSLARLLGPVADRFALLALEKGLDFRVRLPDIAIEADPALFEAMVANLLSNAVKYTERGGVLLAARRRGAATSVEVWDTGVGIPADRIDEVFGEFVQLHNPERDRNKGLGLGLAVCRRLSGLTGHALTVASRPGRGSVFRVRVPRASAPVESPEVAVAPQGEVAGALVLLIDDDAEVREAMAALLRAWGVWLEAAPDVAGALALIEKGERYPDVMVTDYRLAGGVSGLDAIAAVRAVVPQALPAIIVTGDAAFARTPDAGVPVLAKPLDPQRLRAALGSALSGQPV